MNSFPETLKRLMARGFFSFPEMLVAINREGGFGEFPPLQYMMQALPASGFLRPVMSAESLAEIDRLAVDFMRLTGFRRDCCVYLFRCFGYAAGLIAEVPVPPVVGSEDSGNGDRAEEPQAVYGAVAQVPPFDPRWSEEEKCRFLTSLVEVNRDNERRLGMKISHPACVGVGKFDFRLTAELSRVDPGATGALFYAVYDREGRIADTAALGVMCYDDVSPLPRMAAVRVAPQDVTKILIFWEND